MIDRQSLGKKAIRVTALSTLSDERVLEAATTNLTGASIPNDFLSSDERIECIGFAKTA